MAVIKDSIIIKKNEIPRIKQEMALFAPVHNQKTGFAIEHRAKKLAPVDTGFLKSNITTEVKDAGMLVIVRSKAAYSGYQEFGTSKMRAANAGQGYMRPAVEAEAAAFIKGWREFFNQF